MDICKEQKERYWKMRDETKKNLREENAKLKEYVEHTDECDIRIGMIREVEPGVIDHVHPPCSCGLDKLLKEE